MVQQVMTTARTTFSVPRATGTPGDDLVAWGLALLVAEIAGQSVTLRDAGTALTVTVPLAFDSLLERTEHPEVLSQRVRLPWLGSTEKNKQSPSGIEWVDRDVLRDEFNRLKEARRSRASQPQGGDAPAVTVSEERALRYPLFSALTNPGPQWQGYNGLAALVQQRLLSPTGLRLILTTYHEGSALDADNLDKQLKDLGITQRGDRWRNPPGFLYPGLNKGPTMRLALSPAITIGQANAADWMLADRGDRSISELYLAYVGYFTVCTLIDADNGRYVLVPAPGEVRVPDGLDMLSRVEIQFSQLDDYLLAQSALAYGRAALQIWDRFRPPARGRRRGPNLILRGVHVSTFWMPSGNTYSLRRQTFAPLPSWLGGVVEQEGVTIADDMLTTHRRRLAKVRSAWGEETRISSEGRTVLSAYVASLDGDLKAWLEAVQTWFPAARSAESQQISLWTTEDIERILMALDERHDILTIVSHPSFERVAAAIRAATVYPHFARQRRTRGQGSEEQSFDPDYDLITVLRDAAGRGQADFLRELFAFAARYNDETMRRNEKVPYPRPMLQTDDLDQVVRWVEADRRGLVAAALLAYGSSRKPRPETVELDGGEPEEVEADITGVGGEAEIPE